MLNAGRQITYFEVDTMGNVRHLHAGPSSSETSVSGDLGGYSYSAFGKVLGASEPSGLTPLQQASPFLWQGKRLIAPNLYDSRARLERGPRRLLAAG